MAMVTAWRMTGSLVRVTSFFQMPSKSHFAASSSFTTRPVSIRAQVEALTKIESDLLRWRDQSPLPILSRMSLSAVAASGTRRSDSARHIRTTPSSLDSAYSWVKASTPERFSREPRMRVTSSVASASVPARSPGDSLALGMSVSTSASSSASQLSEIARLRSARVMGPSGAESQRLF